jgi:transcriptional regulator with XRE-family HTH domain
MIGKHIKELYKTLGITQREFAVEIDFTQAAISKLESGASKKASRKLIDAICSINWPGHGYVNRDWLLTGKGNMFIKKDVPEHVREKQPLYGIPDNCPADPICQQICIYCMSLPPDDKKSTLSLLEIFKYGRDSTKTAIRQNISEFHELIRPSDHEKDFKRSKKATGTGSK